MLPVVQETRIRSLADMARALGRSEALFRLLEIAAEEARVALEAASVSVSRLETGTSTVRTIVNVGDLGPTEERWPDSEIYDMEDFANLAVLAEERRPWRASLDDPSSDARELLLLAELGKHCAIGSPIIVDGQLWGEFYATRETGRPDFGSLDASYMEALMAILGGAISRSLREESLEQLAYRDPLTGLLNRRALDERAAQAFEVSPGGRRTVTVVSLDINRLKQVNDTLGHLAGDQLIQSVSRALTTEFGRLPGSARRTRGRRRVHRAGERPRPRPGGRRGRHALPAHVAVRAGRGGLGRSRHRDDHPRHGADARAAVRGGRPCAVRREARSALLHGGRRPARVSGGPHYRRAMRHRVLVRAVP